MDKVGGGGHILKSLPPEYMHYGMHLQLILST